MFYFYILLPLFIIIGVIVWLIAYSASLSSVRNNQKEINNMVIENLKGKNFKPTKTIYLEDNATYNREDNSIKKFFSIDNENKKVLLVDYNNSCFYIVDFKDILSYEVYENGNTITDGAQVGGVFTGLFSASTTTKCTDLRLIIKLNSIEISQICYEIIECGNFGGVQKTSNDYRGCVAKMQEATSLLDVIIKENNTTKK